MRGLTALFPMAWTHLFSSLWTLFILLCMLTLSSPGSLLFLPKTLVQVSSRAAVWQPPIVIMKSLLLLIGWLLT